MIPSRIREVREIALTTSGNVVEELDEGGAMRFSHGRFINTTTLRASTRRVFPSTSGSEPGSAMS